MTDRHAGYVVALAHELREDDAEQTLNAIRMIKGVLGVEPIVESFELQVAKMRAENEIKERVLKAVWPS